MKKFETAAKQRRAAAVGTSGEVLPDVRFEVDGVEFLAMGPKDTQLAVLIAAASETRDNQEKVVALLDFFETVLAQPGRNVIRKRMLDPKDPFDLENVIEIFEFLTESWGGRPSTSANA